MSTGTQSAAALPVFSLTTTAASIGQQPAGGFQFGAVQPSTAAAAGRHLSLVIKQIVALEIRQFLFYI